MTYLKIQFRSESTHFLGHVEFSLPVNLPGIVSIGQPLVEVSLYEHLCVHVCSLVALVSAEYYQQLVRKYHYYYYYYYSCSKILYYSTGPLAKFWQK